jgi:GxxExxY protein
MSFDDELTIHELSEPPAEVDHWARLVIGAAIEVRRHLGPGHLEESYEEAMAIELELRGIPFERQARVPLVYKGRPIAGYRRIDFLVGGILVVELKAVECFAPIHKAQVIAYLAATGHPLALLINFNVPLLKDGIRRIVRT